MRVGRIRRGGMLGLLAVSLVACNQAAPACPAKAVGDQIWVATFFNIEGVLQVAPQTAREFFDAPGSYMIEDWNVWPWTFDSQPTAAWASEAEFQSTIDSSARTLSGVKAVLYDPELWPATPAAEQSNLAGPSERFAATAHRLGYTAIVTPGLTLTEAPGAACSKHSDETVYDAYIRCDIAGQAARSADIVEVQAQTLQGHPDEYRSFVEKAAAQARAANPSVDVISGLRVRTTESIDDVKRTWTAASGAVDGFYLAMNPADAAELLQWISGCEKK